MSSKFYMSGQLNRWQGAWGWTMGISAATPTLCLLTTYQVVPPAPEDALFHQDPNTHVESGLKRHCKA